MKTFWINFIWSFRYIMLEDGSYSTDLFWLVVVVVVYPGYPQTLSRYDSGRRPRHPLFNLSCIPSVCVIVAGIFTVGIFAVGIFTVALFAVWNFRRTEFLPYGRTYYNLKNDLVFIRLSVVLTLAIDGCASCCFPLFFFLTNLF